MPSTSGPKETGPGVAALFLGFPFFELVSLTGLGRTIPEAVLTGCAMAVATWLLLFRRVDGLSQSPDTGALRFECPFLTLALRVTLSIAIGVALRGVFLFWSIAIDDWIDVRPSHVILEPLLALFPGRGAVYYLITAAFLGWTLWRALGSPIQARWSTQLLSGVAVMILAFALLTYQRALPAIWAGFDGWDVWDLKQVVPVWLYACAATLAAPALAGVNARSQVFTTFGFAGAFAMASLTSWAPIAALRMRGGNLTGSPPDVFHVIGLTGRGVLGGLYAGSALLILLASMGTAIAFVFVLRRVWSGKLAGVAAGLVVVMAWAPWPTVELLQLVQILHGIGLGLSALAGVALARSGPSTSPIQERVAAFGALAAAAVAFLSANRVLDYAPFLVGTGLMVLLSRVRRSGIAAAGPRS